MFQLLQRWLLPYHCVLCHQTSDQHRDLCTTCQASLPYLVHCCKQCAAPLPTGERCGACLKKPPCFDRTFALFRYEAPINQWITQLKFHRNLRNARLLSELFLEKHLASPLIRGDREGLKNLKNTNPTDLLFSGEERQATTPDLIIPVPLHPKRLRQRGFNQALELARLLAKQVNVPLDKHRCKRVRHTQAQSSIPAKQRHTNLKRAFQCCGQVPRHVAIVDDVITTGHTVNELSRILRQAGCQQIDVWAIARTTRHPSIN